ncbi:MAG: hypothetical protein DIU78_003555 [Pseudomonadota bacterium]
MSQPMTESRFRYLAEAYGSRIERWPEAERAAARALLAARPELSRVLSAEAELDAAFEALAVPEVPSSLERRLLDVPKRVIRPRRAWLRAWFVPAVGWAAAAAVGLWIGGQLEGVPNGNGLDDSEAWVELAAGELAVLEEVP